MKKRTLVIGSVILAAVMSISLGATAFAAVGQQKAEDIALEHAGLTSSDIKYIFSETDWEHGTKVYDVEFLTNDLKEYDYEINAETGSIISFDYDAEHSFEGLGRSAENGRREGSGYERSSRSSEGSKLRLRDGSHESWREDRRYSYADTAEISEAEAEAIALETADVKSSDVSYIRTKLDFDDGRLLYEIEFVSGIMEYELEIDADTGKVLDFDADSIYD